ncbi:LiaI-LiaF-like domain-containing protein [Bacillaceae bacterium W0354]
MKKQKSFLAILLIGIGVFFLLQQYSIPYLSQFGTWPTILIILGIAFLFNGYGNKNHDSLFPGVILLGLGIHFHALEHADKWIDHWGMYTLIVGFAFLIKAHKANQGIVPGIILIIISFIALTSIAMPSWFSWFDYVFNTLEQFWPFILIVVGCILLFKK